VSSSTPYLAAVLLAILSLSIPLSAQSTSKPAVKAPRGSISGRVTIKERGVPGIAIGLRKGEAFTPFEPYQKTITDQDGYYRIPNLAAGSYTVNASAPAFVMADAKDSGKMKSVLIGEDENVEGINFSLLRGGVITGRVTDANERPVIEQQVNIYPADSPEQRKPLFAVSGAQTDDRGVYRAFGLLPGRYRVAAGVSDDESINTYIQIGRVSYKQVFYTDATDQAKATTIEVKEGSEVDNIDITLGGVAQTFSVSGQLLDEHGEPVPSLRFGLQRLIGQRIEFTDRFEAANSHGDFVIEGLVPGKYAFFLIANPNSELRADAVTFDVVDHDVTGLTVKIVKGATIAGTVVLESEDKAALAQLLNLQLRAYGTVSMGGGATIGASGISQLGPDGSFRVAGLPAGTISFFLWSAGSPMPSKGFTITRVEHDGVTSTRSLEIKESEQVMGVRLFVSYGTATLRGVITVENGSVPPKGRIFLRLAKAGEQFSNLRPALVDERGHFQMDGLPAGIYELSVVIADPAQSTRSIKREVTLLDGQTTDLTIKVEP
jgi:carboxypeptidase family protein